MRAARQRNPVVRGRGVITALVPKRGADERLVVHLEGSRAFDLAAVVAEQAGLQVGQILEEDDQAGLLRLDAPYRAREKALAWLTLRDRSCREIEVRLRSAGFEPEVVGKTVAWLQRLDYLDDRRFATGYAAEQLAGGWGPPRVRAELLRKGVDRGLIEECLADLDPGGGEVADGLQAVTALARRRFGSQFHTDPAAAERRLAGFLARRGYDWESVTLVSRTLREECAGSEVPDTADEAGQPLR